MKKDLFSLVGKVVAITGGSGFLGKQYSKALRARGARVVNWDITEGIDVTDPNSLKGAASEVIKKFGKIDIVITNAAVNSPPGPSAKDNWAPYHTFSKTLWDKEFSVNLTGSHLTVQAVAPFMMRRHSGSIILVASDLALIGPQNQIYKRGMFKDIAYITSKAGILGLMRAWAAYLGPYNVRVNALVPGGMENKHDSVFRKKNSELSMLGRMSRYGEYNGAVVFLASDASMYMTGSCLIIDGGRTAW